MKTMYLILTMLLLFTGCEKEEAKEEEQQDPSVIALQKIYDNSNGKGDAISITMEDLEATKVTDLIATKLPQYQTSIGAKTDFSNPSKVSELQILVMNVNENSLLGSWSLIEYSAGFTITIHYNVGDIVWTFKENNIINVVINIDLDGAYPYIKANGDYTYSLPQGNKIFIKNIESDYIITKRGELFISNIPESDGPSALLTKNNIQ